MFVCVCVVCVFQEALVAFNEDSYILESKIMGLGLFVATRVYRRRLLCSLGLQGDQTSQS